MTFNFSHIIQCQNLLNFCSINSSDQSLIQTNIYGNIYVIVINCFIFVSYFVTKKRANSQSKPLHSFLILFCLYLVLKLPISRFSCFDHFLNRHVSKTWFTPSANPFIFLFKILFFQRNIYIG